ncbi:hypothetical protein ACVWWS_001387 [Pseudomonas chlororaphis]
MGTHSSCVANDLVVVENGCGAASVRTWQLQASGIARLEKNRKQFGPGLDAPLAVDVFLMDVHDFGKGLQLTSDLLAGATAEHQVSTLVPGVDEGDRRFAAFLIATVSRFYGLIMLLYNAFDHHPALGDCHESQYPSRLPHRTVP